MPQRIRLLLAAAYVWLCQYVAQAGHYGVKPQHEREPRSRRDRITMAAAGGVLAVTLPVHYGGRWFGWPPPPVPTVAGAVAVVAFNVLVGIKIFGRARKRTEAS